MSWFMQYALLVSGWYPVCRMFPSILDLQLYTIITLYLVLYHTVYYIQYKSEYGYGVQV